MDLLSFLFNSKENIILGLSNLYGFVPAYIFYRSGRKGDLAGSLVLASSVVSSIVFHLIEYDSHGMPGIGIFQNELSQQVFLNIDRLCAVGAMYYFFNYKTFLNSKWLQLCSLIGITCLGFSELTTYYKSFHCIWHLLVFHIAYLLSKKKLIL